MTAFFEQGDKMQMQINQMTLLGAILGTLAGAGACQALAAEPAPAAASPAPAMATRAVQQQTGQVAGWGAPAQTATLSRSRGGTDTVSNDARLGATVSNNTAINLATGNNIIDSGSFANMTGMPMVIQNTGANVLIQNATVINLQLK